MRKYASLILVLISILCIIILWRIGPIPQDPAYHDFADQRIIYGIPNFWDVMSNIPMFFIGMTGLYLSFSNFKERPGFVAKAIPIILCLGMMTACFGSAYYHWSPDNFTLVWDRLPMTLMFMPLFALLIYDFIGKSQGEKAFYLLIPLGIISVFYWHFTELSGQGDLRIYAFVQFFPMIAAPFILVLYPKKTNYVKYILLILAWYILAKISEYYDHEIYEFTQFWSGHTIKHLFSAVSLIYVVKLIMAWDKKWSPIGKLSYSSELYDS